MSTYALPKITLDDAKRMTKPEMLRALAKHDALRKINEGKGYSWNKPAGDVLREQNPEKWKLLGSPGEDDPTPLRELVGLKDDVRIYMERTTRTGGGLRARPQTKKEAKKTCYPGYEVYNFRKTRKGVFYDCAPKRRARKTLRRYK